MKQKVLIVDDETRNQRIMIEILEDLVDFKVASSGEEALKILENYSPDVVLLDIMMPGIDGYAVCKQIRANSRLSLTKIILVSGKAMIEERLAGYDIGADEYMTKPFVPEELLAKVKVFLRLTGIEKELGEMNRSLDAKVQERTKQLIDTEAKLISAAKMSALGEMAGGIAHEVNTPLGVIALAAGQLSDLIAEQEMDRSAIKDMATMIEDTVKRIGRIIQGLRSFSRDGSKDCYELIPIQQIIEDTLGLCGEKLKNSGVRVQVECTPKTLRFNCQTVQMSQVFLNLINNACDAIPMGAEGWIKISANETERGILISVTDNGSGISEFAREKLFTPFFTTKEIGKGTGLGLSISKGIIESHGGKLALNSKTANTCFEILLPTSAVLKRAG